MSSPAYQKVSDCFPQRNFLGGLFGLEFMGSAFKEVEDSGMHSMSTGTEREPEDDVSEEDQSVVNFMGPSCCSVASSLRWRS